MRRMKDLSAALDLLHRVASDPTLAAVRREKLLNARRKLKRVGRTTRPRRDDVYDAVRAVAEALWDALHADDPE